jgi:hypothetical protein
MERTALAHTIAECGSHVLHIGPSALPHFIDADVDVRMLNLLHDQYEPSAIASMRRRWRAWVIILLIVCGGLLAAGFERRTATMRSRCVAIERTRASIVQGALQSSMLAVSDMEKQQLDVRLASELRRLRQTRRQPAREARDDDVTEILAALLKQWPAPVLIQAESILITPTALTIRAVAPTSADVQAFATALQDLPQWELQQPQINAARDCVQTTVQLRKQGVPAP